MKFKTKFGIGDNVFFAIRGKTYSGIVKSVNINMSEYTENENPSKLKQLTTVSYSVAYKSEKFFDDYFVDKFNEKELFASKSELEESQQNEKC